MRVLARPDRNQRTRALRIAGTAVAATLLVALLASGAWLMIAPASDQPLLSLVERATGLGPSRWLRPAERDAYANAAADAVRFQGEVERLNAAEKAARYQGTPLSDDDIRRIASYQATFLEMARGERFVQEVLRAKARVRARWWVGVPCAVVALGGLFWLGWRSRSRPRALTWLRDAADPKAAVRR